MSFKIKTTSKWKKGKKVWFFLFLTFIFIFLETLRNLLQASNKKDMMIKKKKEKMETWEKEREKVKRKKKKASWKEVLKREKM